MTDYPLTRITKADGSKVFVKYSHEWPSVDPKLEKAAAELAIELECFRIGEEVEGRTKYDFFRAIVEIWWPDFEWHRWAAEEARGICENRIFALTGSASSGKTAIMVLYGLVSYIADPENVIVFVLTTTVKDAEQRIWKEYTYRFNQLKRRGLTGFKMVNREHYIGMSDSSRGAGKGTSIQLVAAGDKDRDNALQKLQGVKAHGKLILEWDESQSCSMDVYRAVTNLVNNPRFELKLTGNAANRFDPHGVGCEPIDGWQSITENSKEWPIKIEGIIGLCLHLDGFDSPNFDDRDDITWNDDGQPIFDKYNESIPDRYPYIKRTSIVKNDIEERGIADPDFWRQCRGFWPPSDVEVETIYPHADLINLGAMKRNVIWLYPPTDGLSVDPSKGGTDRYVVTHIKYGIAKFDDETRPFPVIFSHERWVLKIKGATDDSSQSKNMVLEVKAIADRLKIPPEHVAVDATAQDPVGDVYRDNWSKKILFVDFQGKPSEMPFDSDNLKTCRDMFDRKVSEIWFIGRLFLRKKQLAGLDLEVAKELSTRRYEDRAGKKRVETKEEMKDRMNGLSPDLGDSFLIGVALCRERFGAVPGGGIIKHNPWADLFGKNTVDTRKQIEVKTLKTQRQFSPRPEPEGSSKGELYRWLSNTRK